MRVIAGRLGGRTINSPRSRRTHPMSDRMRGGLFNALGDIAGLSVLDAFAGSGALGIEAISRGASHVTAIDADKTAHQQITTTIRELGIDNLKATRAFVKSWSNNNPEKTFDLILADPPYNDLQIKDIIKLAGHLNKNGAMVLSWPGKETSPELAELKALQTKSYGDSQLVFYRKIS